jgi:anti-anti-sigma regulatory factor
VIPLPPTLIAGKGITETKELFEKSLEEGTIRIIADASKLGFIDYPALGFFIGLLKTAQEKGGDLRIMNLHGWPLDFLEENGVKNVFTLQQGDDLFPAREGLLQHEENAGITTEYEIIGDVGVFHFSGTMQNIKEIKIIKQKFLLALVDRKKFLFDFENLLFLYSKTIGEIIGFHRILKLSSGKLRICNANAEVKELLLKLNIDVLVPIFNNLPDALKGW